MKKNRWAAILLSMTLLGGCSSAPQAEPNDRLQIITTIFPEYDWVMNVLGENPGEAEVTLLLDNGVDLHSYQPSAEDILKISTCDVFIYVGGESDAWVDDALKNALNEDMIVINLLESLGDTAKEEEHVEGMQEEDHDAESPEYDEHVWLSLRNAEVLTGVIADALSTADPDNADSYRANAEVYIAELQELDEEYAETVESAERKTLLFGDRFPFRYLTDDYGLDYYAAFAGCSAETEASFETVVFLAGKVDELSLPAIMTIEGTNHRIAETIRENTASKDQEILVLDSMQGTTSKDVQNGISYLSIMEKNLEV
ncbi:MAG: zinc ABC transporter substrate-binding protein, partial [Solobacterium sp.]|nr:zinc ABC transporter substrate-binding protein [Solobacterium sp.]